MSQTSMSGADQRADAPNWLRIVLVVFLPFASGYFLSYLYRALPSILGGRIRDDLALDAEVLGLVGAAYFLAFGAAQLPLGMMLDRYGPRRCQAALMIVAAIGATVFGLGDNAETLIIGRALIGLGCAGGLMASLKAITLWFPQARWPLVNGCLLGLGGLGALTATTPVEYLLGFIGWHEMFFYVAVATILSAMLIFLVVPEKPGAAAPVPFSELVGSLRNIYSNRYFWRIAPIAILTMSTGMAIHTQWAGLWLKDVAGLGQDAVALHLQTLSIALTAGFLMGGVVADLATRSGIPLGGVLGAGVVGLLTSQLAIALAVDPQAHWPWILLGLSSNISALAFPLLCGRFDLRLAGRVNTALNVFVFTGVFAAASAIGWIIGLYPRGANGAYAAEGYEVGLLSIIALEVVAFVWFMIPEKRK